MDDTRSSKMDDTTSYQPETPQMCANGCGFFGSSATRNLCSKCYNDYLKEEMAKSAKVICIEKPMSSSSTTVQSGLISSINQPSLCPDHHEGTVNNSDASTSVGDSTAKKKNRCWCCKKRVGLTGFGCRCGGMFCGMHRYPETHSCTFDYKTAGRVALAKENPLCVGGKLEERI